MLSLLLRVRLYPWIKFPNDASAVNPGILAPVIISTTLIKYLKTPIKGFGNCRDNSEVPKIVTNTGIFNNLPTRQNKIMSDDT
jgi:hypothetical protein